jgi:hypothetical protein
VTWTKISDSFWDDPDVLEVGDAAAGLFVRMIAYSNRQGTDGRITDAIARTLARNRAHRSRAIRALLGVAFLIRAEGGYEIRSFHKYNPKAAVSQAKRAADAERKRAERAARPDGQTTDISPPDPDPDPDPGEGGIGTLAALEAWGFDRYGALAGRRCAPRLSAMLPIYPHELDAVAKTRGRSWAYCATVIESQREAAADVAANPPPKGRPRNGNGATDPARDAYLKRRAERAARLESETDA